MATAEGRFTLSAPFRILLDEVIVDEMSDDHQPPRLTHTECGDYLCEIEDGDSMAVLVQTVLEHDCPARPGATT